MRRAAMPLTCCALLVGCEVGEPGAGGDDGPGGADGGLDPDAGLDPASCDPPPVIPPGAGPVDLMPPARLAAISARLPCVAPGPVRDAIESPDTVWYDARALVPGYQDSFGDNVELPIGMRPNTIDPQMIDLAVPGGHAQIFVEVGTFHFPFGRPTGPSEEVAVVDLWQVPRAGDAGPYLPVVWWRRDPNTYTHRVEWMFPVGTLFAELLFLDEAGALHPFEIRTRTRTPTGWAVDVYRPFPRAADLAAAIEARRGERPEWADSPELDALVAHLGDPSTLSSAWVAGAHFGDAFPPRDGWYDTLPAVSAAAAELLRELLRTTPFRSARGIAWKQDGARRAWAASASAPGSVVPAGYNAGAIEVSEASCDVCHRDAGRPFEAWYPNLVAYGELWGGDEIFTWHPFTIDRFVDEDGGVVNFNHDNREIRPDFAAAGLIERYDPDEHSASIYRRIVRDWTDFEY